MLENINSKDLEIIKGGENADNIVGYMQLTLLYDAAIKILETKLQIIEKEYNLFYGYNPIHTIESRIKTPASVIDKLKRRDYEVSLESIRKNLKDVAGVRIICDYIEDVSKVSEVLKNQEDLQLVEEEDYIKNPKKNGYRSLHLVFLVPVRLTNRTEIVPVEVQIRTIAMDFWASLEHKLRYKQNVEMSNSLKIRLKACAEIANRLDEEMQSINEQMKDLK